MTGGTGFLGKLFIEKLIRCNVKELVLLSRGKKSKTAKERIDEILSTEAVSLYIEV